VNVTVYVPCYNGAVWLEECLRALLAQTVPADEILVVDDGSTDNSADISASFGAPVRVVPHERNRGLAVARNTALAAARNDLVASVDADVRAEPGWLAGLLDGLDSPRTAAVGGRLDELHQGRLADRWRAAHMAQHAGGLPQVNPPILPGANTLVRREVVQALGGYDESFRTNYEDADLLHRLVAAGYRCRYEPAAHAYHLRTDTPSSVLRTYWGWLRPPFERTGAFLTVGGLSDKQDANARFALQALWQDFSGGTPELSYLSLMVLLLFPAADLAHAATRAESRGDPTLAAHFAQSAANHLTALPDAVAPFSARLAADMARDVPNLAWWSGAHAGVQGAQPPLGLGAKPQLQSLPRAWRPHLQASRDAVAHDAGWPV
jgi:hypothetical protein